MLGFLKKRREAKFFLHRKAAFDLWNEGQRQAAIGEMEKALRAKPDWALGWCRLADFCDTACSDRIGRNDTAGANEFRQKAISSVKEAIRLRPEFAEAHYVLGNILWAEDFRKALAEFEIAAKHDPEYEHAVTRARKLVAKHTFRLKDLKIVCLNSLKESPLPQVYDAQFYFEDGPFGCVVFYACFSGTKRQWVHAWLFENEQPDLFQDRPLGHVTIASTGQTMVSSGSPSNYWAIIHKLRKEGLL